MFCAKVFFPFRILEELQVEHNVTEKFCPTPLCPDTNMKYRNYDGSCNNPKNPKLGWTHTPFQRILPNAYSDRNA